MSLVTTVLAALFAAGLGFTVPDGWKQSPGSSSMRVAEFSLPRAAGGAEDAQLIVDYFGGSGGSIDAKINRWIAQMQQADGKPSAAATRDTKKVTRVSSRRQTARTSSS